MKNKAKISRVILIGIIVFITFTACNKTGKPNNTSPKTNEDMAELENNQNNYKVNKEGMDIESRYPVPKGYKRIDVEEKSFAAFLRAQRLKTYGEKVLYHDGREKNKKDVYDSVFDVEIGDRDLHQCADAIMLLRGEYLYQNKRYDDISFNFVSGFKAEYNKWMEGYRIKIDGNQVNYYKATDPSNSYESFRKYMDIVMAYASTLSLEKELESVSIEDIKIGDVFIQGGSPGHAVIVVDMAINDKGEKIFLLAQSYMPAQETQILINPEDKENGPWYSLKNRDRLITPEWNFELTDVKRF